MTYITHIELFRRQMDQASSQCLHHREEAAIAEPILATGGLQTQQAKSLCHAFCQRGK